jgi:1-acyl-sn-glycerol-3-phosphate acyltransferase
LRPFKHGAFQIAIEAMVPVIPIAISFQDKKGIFPLFSPKRIILKVGAPIKPDLFELKKPAIESLSETTSELMSELLS